MGIIRIKSSREDLPPSPSHAVQRPPRGSARCSGTCTSPCGPPASAAPGTSCKSTHHSAPGLFSKGQSKFNTFQLIQDFFLQYMFVIRRKTHTDFIFFLNKPLQTFPFCTQELDFGQSSHGRVTVDSILADSIVI